jgi:hypothetical protein
METQRTIACLVLGGCLAAGCSPKGARMNLITYDDMGTPNRHYSDFGRASFRWQSDNLIELVFQTQAPSTIDPTQTITQMVYIGTIWAPRYGVTNAEETQINAHVQYAILTPPTGVRYDGTAFVSYKIDPNTKEAVGRIESGDLTPVAKMGDATEPFGPARITGTFRASDNGGEVVNVIQAFKTQFNQPIVKK